MTNQYHEDDQDDADDTNAAVTEAITVAAEAATEAPKQEDDEQDDEYEPKRHVEFSPCSAQPKIETLRYPTVKPLIDIFGMTHHRQRRPEICRTISFRWRCHFRRR